MSDYRDLRAWKAAKALAIRCYQATNQFPKAEEYGLKSQIRRAAVSVPANIAEGSGRYSDRDFVRFIRIARGSVSELETLIAIASDLGYLNAREARALQTNAGNVGKMLSGLARSLRESSRD